jgi:hypothetical protein
MGKSLPGFQSSYSVQRMIAGRTRMVMMQGNAAPDAMKNAADRLKCAQQLEPPTVKLGEWPFNRQIILKFAVSPSLSLAASFGKDVWNLIWHPNQ